MKVNYYIEDKEITISLIAENKQEIYDLETITNFIKYIYSSNQLQYSRITIHKLNLYFRR